MYTISKGHLLANYCLLIMLLLVAKTITMAQSVDLGWKGSAMMPLNLFTDKDRWICNFNQGARDSGYITTNDTCVFLHWKFGSGKRDKFVQFYQVMSPTISLSDKDIFGFDVKGSKCDTRRNIQLKFEDGTIQGTYKWDGLASITRWCESVSVLKKQIGNGGSISWNAVKVISFEVNSGASDNDILPDSGTIAFKKLKTDSAASWVRATSFETLNDSSVLPIIAKQALKAILNRQNSNTGLFCTWLADKVSYLYGQGLVLKILSSEGQWENSKPVDSCSRAAEKLALFLVKNQDKLGFWPRAWKTETGDIIYNLEGDGTVWMGDFPWIITGLQNYYNKSKDKRVIIAIEKAKFFLYNLIDSDGKFYTINPLTKVKYEVSSGEAYTAAILSVNELGDSSKANKMLQYIDSKTWDTELKYWQEAINAPRVVLFANTWLSAFFKKTSDAQKSLDALSFSGKVLYTKGPSDPAGFDGIGPIATWYEGTLSYICAGGTGSRSLFYNLVNHRYPDGTVPHYNDSVSVAGIWAVKWSSLDGTSWLYYAASRKSPFDRLTTLDTCKTEPKKVLMHYMGWFGTGITGQHWSCGQPRKPLIDYYDSRSWTTSLYHILLSWSCGIDGLVINVKDDFDEQSLKVLMPTINKIRDIDSTDFKYEFAISYDDQGMDKKEPLDTALRKISYLRDYILPNTSNYLYYYDRPAVFVFNYPNKFLTAKNFYDVTSSIFTEKQPIILWNEIEADAIDYINSSYPWVGPDNTGWYANGKNWGRKYLQWYYPEVNQYGLNLNFTTGGVWPGFDDKSNNCWGEKNRWMDRQNGTIYDSTWTFVNNYQSPLPLKWVIIETWNDWNEGTEIEPSNEFGYKYLKSTIKSINDFKNTNISLDTCKFEAARKIYEASRLIELKLRDSVKHYPDLKLAIKNLILKDCSNAISFAENIISNINENSISGIKIYPNPSNNKLNIELNDIKQSTMRVIGIKGDIMLTKIINRQFETIDISNLPKGVYFIQILQEHKSFVKKIVLN
ncbi:MAG: T9SS type A sorting domain-containing protein [Bacteroidales bacterium]|nr:T9SS type A sorting domain-containing protein [Bacteroidales bacterium]